MSAQKAIDSLQAAAATATIDDTTIKAPAGKSMPAKAANKHPGASRWGRKPAGAKPAAKKATARTTKKAKAAPRKRTARTS